MEAWLRRQTAPHVRFTPIPDVPLGFSFNCPLITDCGYRISLSIIELVPQLPTWTPSNPSWRQPQALQPHTWRQDYMLCLRPGCGNSDCEPEASLTFAPGLLDDIQFDTSPTTAVLKKNLPGSSECHQWCGKSQKAVAERLRERQEVESKPWRCLIVSCHKPVDGVQTTDWQCTTVRHMHASSAEATSIYDIINGNAPGFGNGALHGFPNDYTNHGFLNDFYGHWHHGRHGS